MYRNSYLSFKVRKIKVKVKFCNFFLLNYYNLNNSYSRFNNHKPIRIVFLEQKKERRK